MIFSILELNISKIASPRLVDMKEGPGETGTLISAFKVVLLLLLFSMGKKDTSFLSLVHGRDVKKGSSGHFLHHT